MESFFPAFFHRIVAHDTTIMTICGTVDNAAWNILHLLRFLTIAPWNSFPGIHLSRVVIFDGKFKQSHIFRVANVVVPIKWVTIMVLMRVAAECGKLWLLGAFVLDKLAARGGFFGDVLGNILRDFDCFSVRCALDGLDDFSAWFSISYQ